MEPDETDTPEGTESVTPENDTEDNSTYWDPDEDQDTPEEDAAPSTDEGTEADEAEEDPEAEPEKATQVVLPDGTQVSIEEVTKGYLRQSDYSQKTMELSNKRQSLDADLQFVENIVQTFVDHLNGLVPAMPDMALLYRDPNAYLRAKVQHEAAMAKVQELVELGKQPKKIGDKLSAEDKRNAILAENAQLVARFPMAATPEGRMKFMESAATAAQEVGFTMADLKGVTDHRMFALAHWANEGMKAAKARETAKAKVANVPPSAPRKPGQPGQANRNVDAMKRLTRSGSIRDAVKVDWE